MRFLLNPAIKPFRVARRESTAKAVTSDALKVSTVSSKNDTLTRSWGQQCASDCGCVVRFESTIDPTSQKIVDINYHAKSIVSLKKDGKLEPIRTTRTNKLMLKDCKCRTVHTLAKEITNFVINKNLDQVRNMNEFSSTRSSLAFRHAVLVENHLPRTDTHCFDVLEEAYTAMLKGYLPRQRREMRSFEKTVVADLVWKLPADDEGETIGPIPKQETGQSKAPLSMSSPRSVSTLSMFDSDAEHWDGEEYQRVEKEEEYERQKSLDWLSFVDEQNRKEEWA